MRSCLVTSLLVNGVFGLTSALSPSFSWLLFSRVGRTPVIQCPQQLLILFDNSHFMPQTVRGCHTDHSDSIVSSMACIFDSKNNM